MVAVDTFGQDRLESLDADDCEEGDLKKTFTLYESSPHRWGAHMQIIKGSELRKFLHRKPVVVDHWKEFEEDDKIITRFWQPKMVAQSSAGPGLWKHPEMCKSTVVQNDNKNSPHAKSFARRMEQKKFTLQC